MIDERSSYRFAKVWEGDGGPQEGIGYVTCNSAVAAGRGYVRSRCLRSTLEQPYHAEVEG